MITPSTTSRQDTEVSPASFSMFRSGAIRREADSAKADTPHVPTALARPKRVRFDPIAVAEGERLVLAALYFAVALIAVIGISSQAETLTKVAWPHWKLWAALFPAGLVFAIGREPAKFGIYKTDERLALIGIAFRCFLVALLVQCLLWLANVNTTQMSLLLTLCGVCVVGCWTVRKVFQKVSVLWHRKLRIVIAGVSHQGMEMALQLQKRSEQIDLLGFVDDRRTRIDMTNLNLPFLGTINDALLLKHPPDAVVIALPNAATQRIHSLTLQLRRNLFDVYLAPEAGLLDLYTARNSNPVLDAGLRLNLNNLSLDGRISKRLFDIVFSLIALTAFIPVGLCIAALIRLESPGPAIFRQPRYGRGNYLFDVYKFRSMRADVTPIAGEIRLTKRGDSRVTRMGAFLRRTSLDEFPQFLNVLLGDMSVVGPRPHPPGVKAGERFYEDVLPEFMERYTTRPGITGWAQVNGLRGNTFTESHLVNRFASDLEYIKNWSIELDMLIVLQTIKGGFGGKNAF